MSQSFSISTPELISVGKGFLIAEAGALLATLAVWVTSGNLDLRGLLLLEAAAGMSTAVNFFRKYFPSTVVTPPIEPGQPVQ